MSLPDLHTRIPAVAQELLTTAVTALGATSPERAYLTLGRAPETVYDKYGDDDRGDALSVRVLRCYPGTPTAPFTGVADWCHVNVTLELRLSLWRMVGPAADVGAYDAELLAPSELTGRTLDLLRDLAVLQTVLVTITNPRTVLGGQSAVAGGIEPERGDVLAGWRVDVRVQL